MCAGFSLARLSLHGLLCGGRAGKEEQGVGVEGEASSPLACDELEQEGQPLPA